MSFKLPNSAPRGTLTPARWYLSNLHQQCLQLEIKNLNALQYKTHLIQSTTSYVITQRIKNFKGYHVNRGWASTQAKDFADTENCRTTLPCSFPSVIVSASYKENMPSILYIIIFFVLFRCPQHALFRYPQEVPITLGWETQFISGQVKCTSLCYFLLNLGRGRKSKLFAVWYFTNNRAFHSRLRSSSSFWL